MNVTNSIRRRPIKKTKIRTYKLHIKFVYCLLYYLNPFVEKNELFKCMKNYQIKMEVDHVKEIIRYILCERLSQLY